LSFASITYFPAVATGSTFTTMIRLTYLSRAAQPFSADDLLTLLSVCHRNNTARGLTGMLLYGNGTFLQCIEGEEAAVETLMQTLLADPRHTDIQTVRRETITARLYKDWSMGFERVTDKTLATVPGLRDMGVRGFNTAYLHDHEEVIETLLERHRAPHWDPLIGELDAREKLIRDLRSELTNAKSHVEMAALVIEAVIETSRNGRLDDTHLDICRSTLQALR